MFAARVVCGLRCEFEATKGPRARGLALVRSRPAIGWDFGVVARRAWRGNPAWVLNGHRTACHLTGCARGELEGTERLVKIPGRRSEDNFAAGRFDRVLNGD